MPEIDSITARACSLHTLAALLVTAALAACSGGGHDGQAGGSSGRDRGDGARGTTEDRAIAVGVAPVERGSVDAVYSTSATVRADRRATVIARTRGVVRGSWSRRATGSQEGQALAVLENDEQRIAAARARTTHETQRARVRARLEGLHEQGLVSEEEYEKARRDAEDAAPRPRAGRARALPHGDPRALRRRHPGAATSTSARRSPTARRSTTSPTSTRSTPTCNVPERHVAQPRARAAGAPDRRRDGEQVARRHRAHRALGRPRHRHGQGDAGGAPARRVLRPAPSSASTSSPTPTRTPWSCRAPALVAEGRRWHLFRLGDDGATVEQIEVELGLRGGRPRRDRRRGRRRPPVDRGRPVVVDRRLGAHRRRRASGWSRT